MESYVSTAIQLKVRTHRLVRTQYTDELLGSAKVLLRSVSGPSS